MLPTLYGGLCYSGTGLHAVHRDAGRIRPHARSDGDFGQNALQKYADRVSAEESMR